MRSINASFNISHTHAAASYLRNNARWYIFHHIGINIPNNCLRSAGMIGINVTNDWYFLQLDEWRVYLFSVAEWRLYRIQRSIVWISCN